jgi:two-component system phosphate regulon sensor histidine kinase PhoR
LHRASGPRPRHPLFHRLFSAFLLLILLILLPLWFFLNDRMRRALEAEIVLRQREELALVEQALAPRWLGASAGPSRVDPVVDALTRDISGRLTVVALDGRVLGDSERSGRELLAMENHALRPEVEAALQGGEGVSVRYSTTVGEELLYRARLVRDGDGEPLAVMRLGFPQAGIRAELDRTSLVFGVALVLALLAAVGLAAVLARRLARPIELLRRSAEEMGRGGLGREIRVQTGDELEELAGAFNRMSADLARQQAQILAEKEQLLGVLEGMVEGVLVTDRSGKVVQANRALQQMFGLARPPLGKTSLEALRNPTLEQVLARSLGQGERAGGVVRLSHPVERQLEVQVAPLGRDGGVHGAVAVFHDVTRLTKLEAVRRDFVANVSHEIRTPVTAIRGYAETLRGAAESADERARFTDIIIRHADRLTNLVDDLLALSSLESAGYVLRLEEIQASELLSTVEEAFRPRAVEKGLALEVGATAPDLSLKGDRGLLEQVLGNLVDNAIKFTEPGGRVRLGAAAAEGSALLTVADTGSGIPATNLERVFERFFRVDRARSRKLGGTGLGLAIVKHIVLLHGGEVRVRSRVGEGSEFTVVLPVGGPPAHSEKGATRDAWENGGGLDPDEA